MTFLEKAMEIENETEKGLKREEVIQRYCPSSYDLEAGNCCSMSALEKCRICWNREMPNTEPIEYCDKCGYVKSQCECEEEKTDVSFTDDLLNTGYNKGLKDAWELARKLYDMKCDEFEKIFGVGGCFYEVIRDFTPQEAIAKLKEYEEARKVEVGDVFESISTKSKGVVSKIEERIVYVFYSNGNVGIHNLRKFKQCFKKTGKHIDIKAILEQIGE